MWYVSLLLLDWIEFVVAKVEWNIYIYICD